MSDPTSVLIAETAIELIRGDITRQGDIDAIVNAANRMLETGGGVAGAIHRAAGPELAAEARQFAPISPGDAVITRAYDLPNTFVIHCLGPVYGTDRPAAELLAGCYRNGLRVPKRWESDRSPSRRYRPGYSDIRSKRHPEWLCRP